MQAFAKLALCMIIALLIPLINYNIVLLFYQKPLFSLFETDALTHAKTQLALVKKSKKILQKKLLLNSEKHETMNEKFCLEYTEINTRYNELKKTHKKEFFLVDQRYRDAWNTYKKIYFFIMTALGFIAISLTIVTGFSWHSIGIMIGGFISIAMGYLLYWDHLQHMTKLTSLIGILVLALLISHKKLLTNTSCVIR